MGFLRLMLKCNHYNNGQTLSFFILRVGQNVGQNMASITQRTISTLPDGRHLIEQNLYIVVRNGGKHRHYVFRYVYNDKRFDLSFGNVNKLRLTEAKEQAVKCRSLLAQGINPKDVRDKRKSLTAKTQTFSDFFYEVFPRIMNVKGYKREKFEISFRRHIEMYCLPYFGSKNIADVTTTDVVEALSEIWEKIPTTANTTRQNLEQVFYFAIQAGVYKGNNPAVWRGCCDVWLKSPSKIKEIRHHDSLSFDELRAMAELASTRLAVPSFSLVLFIALLACRTTEARLMKWSEVDFENKILTIPPERRKVRSNEPFRFPLSEQALFIINQQPRISEYVFCNRTTKKPLCLGASLRQMQRIASKTTTHGLRSTFRDWCEHNDVPEKLAESSLMHTLGGSVRKAYQRDDLCELRRPHMQRWADAVISMDKLVEGCKNGIGVGLAHFNPYSPVR